MSKNSHVWISHQVHGSLLHLLLCPGLLFLMKRPAVSSLASQPAKKAKEASPARPHPCEDQVPCSRVASGNRELWYCSDCSGVDVGAMALKKVVGSFKHWFASEIDGTTRKVLRATHPDIVTIHEDVTKHDLKALGKERAACKGALMYTSGFPCQPFSGQGLQLGTEDSRGNIVYDNLKVVEVTRPDVVVFENVAALATQAKFKVLFTDILDLLQSIGNRLYLVDWKILDSYTCGRVPASRERVYIVAVRKDRLVKKWSWPTDLPPVGLKSVLSQGQPQVSLKSLSKTSLQNLAACMTKLKREGVKNLKEEPYVVDLAGGVNFGLNISYNKFPTITRSHANTLWLCHEQRWATPDEILRAQGIKHSDVKIPDDVSMKSVARMAGNSFTLTVFQRLFESLLPAIGVAVK